MAETALDRKTIISALARSPHGALTEYLDIGLRAAREDPDFFAHLLAWNHVNGEVRDAKVALPIIALTAVGTSSGAYRHNVKEQPTAVLESYAENALAHLADLNPRTMSKALLPTIKMTVDPKDKKGKRKIRVIGENGKPVEVPSFAVQARAPQRVLRRLVTRYLRDLESDRKVFERTALLHRNVLWNLYSHYHVSCPAWVSEVLFHGEKGKPKVLPTPGSVFDIVRRLKDMSPEEAAGAIVKYRIPFLIARGALGAKSKDPDQVLALINAMSPTELVTNMKWLESVGVKTVPALRSALEKALGKAAKAPKSMLKASRAAEALSDDSKLATKLHALQEKQLEQSGGIDGDWLVLGDKSGSMERAIDTARQVAAMLSRMVKGKVHLIFFDTVPQYIDATGKTLEELTRITRAVMASGGTSIGCGLRYAMDRNISVEGIAIVSDGGENTAPYFGHEYTKYCEKNGNEPTVYLYQTEGESDYNFNRECDAAKLDVQRFDLKSKHIDYHSLPNLIKTMRVSRYSLLDDVLATPLRTLDEVLERTAGMKVLPQIQEQKVTA